MPFLGWGLWAMGMPARQPELGARQSRARQYLRQDLSRTNGPYGSSHTASPRDTRPPSTSRLSHGCKQNDKRVPRNTLYPRTKGFVATVNELRHSTHVKAVYDCTIGYAQGKKFLHAPSFWQSLSMPRIGNTWDMHVHVDRWLLEELPTGESRRLQIGSKTDG